MLKSFKKKASCDEANEYLHSVKSLNLSHPIREIYSGSGAFAGITDRRAFTTGTVGLESSSTNPLISNIELLSEFIGLVDLNLEGNIIKDIAPLEKLENLESLTLTGNEIVDLSPIVKLSKLKQLNVGAIPAEDFTPLSSLDQLTDLRFTGRLEVEKMSDLKHLIIFSSNYANFPYEHLNSPDLIKISLSNTSFSFSSDKDFSNLKHIKSIQLENVDINSVDGLSNFSFLEEFFFKYYNPLGVDSSEGCAGLIDISPLANLSHLHTLLLYSCGIWFEVVYKKSEGPPNPAHCPTEALAPAVKLFCSQACTGAGVLGGECGPYNPQ
ncbi:MAG: hypothetical protein NTX25_20635 [Proteobacteria bacterium]|nr:hypothetical protein [Pseudomonadota bacterium]